MPPKILTQCNSPDLWALLHLPNSTLNLLVFLLLTLARLNLCLYVVILILKIW